MRFLGLLLAVPASALCAPFVTSAEFAVSDGGAATLSVPLQVPRGIGGMEPKLALNYASGTSNGRWAGAGAWPAPRRSRAARRHGSPTACAVR